MLKTSIVVLSILCSTQAVAMNLVGTNTCENFIDEFINAANTFYTFQEKCNKGLAKDGLGTAECKGRSKVAEAYRTLEEKIDKAASNDSLMRTKCWNTVNNEMTKVYLALREFNGMMAILTKQ